VELVGAEGAPWWGVPVIAGLFLVGGATMGFGSSWLLEGRRAKTKLRQRFLNEILSNAATLVKQADTIVSLASERASWLRLEDHVRARASTQEWLDDNWTALTAEADDLIRSRATLALTAPPAVVEASNALARNAALLLLRGREDAEITQGCSDLIGRYGREMRAETRKAFGIAD
jgi:hypothetical protein